MENSEQRSGGAGISADGVGRRLGESGGKWRGARVLPSGGLGSSGGGPERQLHGEGRTAAGLFRRGGAPATEVLTTKFGIR